MKFKSPVYSQVSGSIAGITYAHTAGTLYARARTIPTDPATAQQIVVRNAMQQINAAWTSTLTQAQRDDWEVYAANTPVVNLLGDSVNRSGQNMFQRGNLAPLQIGLTLQADAPSVFNLGDFTAPTLTSMTAATDTLVIAFTATDGWVSEDGSAMTVSMSRPQNPSVNFFKGPYQFADSIDGNSTIPPTSPKNIVSPFGTAVGQRVFIKVNVIRADGRYSNPWRGSVLAV